jgi:hypothetical protein
MELKFLNCLVVKKTVNLSTLDIVGFLDYYKFFPNLT